MLNGLCAGSSCDFLSIGSYLYAGLAVRVRCVCVYIVGLCGLVRLLVTGPFFGQVSWLALQFGYVLFRF
jgi:hypothetical protein